MKLLFFNLVCFKETGKEKKKKTGNNSDLLHQLKYAFN